MSGLSKRRERKQVARMRDRSHHCPACCDQCAETLAEMQAETAAETAAETQAEDRIIPDGFTEGLGFRA